MNINAWCLCLGGNGDTSSLLRLLLLGGGGLGGKGKGGLGFNPLLLSLLSSSSCTEKYPICVQPGTANVDGKRLCGLGDQDKCAMPNDPWDAAFCLPCCTCPDTPNALLEAAP